MRVSIIQAKHAACMQHAANASFRLLGWQPQWVLRSTQPVLQSAWRMLGDTSSPRPTTDTHAHTLCTHPSQDLSQPAGLPQHLPVSSGEAGGYSSSLTGSNLVSLAGSCKSCSAQSWAFSAELDFISFLSPGQRAAQRPLVPSAWCEEMGSCTRGAWGQMPRGLGHSKPGSHGTRRDP